MTRVLVLFLAIIQLAYSADPFRPEFSCKLEDLQAVGMTCSDEEPCPIYLEIGSAWGSGSKIFLAGNIHSAQTTLLSILLASDDGGATWREPTPRLQGMELDKIQFLNTEKGWISGQRVYPLPRDPFLLLTDDGGKSWRNVEVLSEGGNGFIQQFWFDSPNGGSLVIDQGASADNHLRYVRYDTSTGGTTWTIAESSEKPLKIGPPFGDSTWRAEADAKQKLTLVQKKEGTRWNTVATLALELGQCRSPEQKEETAPPETEPATDSKKPDAPVKEFVIGGPQKAKPKKKPHQ